MALLDINWRPTRSDLRIFSLLLWLFLLGISLLWWNQAPQAAGSRILLAVATALLLLWLLLPELLRPVYLAWMVLAFPIGWLISHLLMAMTFYLVVTPIGLIMRLCGYDPMRRRFDRAADSYWQQHEKSGPSNDDRYFQQY